MRIMSDAMHEELARLRQLEATVFNYLGTKDPKEVADWINGARQELAQHRAAEDGE